jgi:(p)ppGpp synthase/HD superfamily hydrolase
MAHLLGVASLVIGEAGSVDFEITEEMAIAAVLHDAVEDHGGELRLKDIEHNFGSDVARMVAGLSDSFSDDATKKDSWAKRKKAYIGRLRDEPPEVRLISAADKLYNARAILADYREIGPRIWERFKRSRNDQLWYFDAVLDVLKASDRNRIVLELERVVRELELISKAEAR